MATIGRRQFTSLALGAAAAREAGANARRPNVIYIILDDLGMYDTGCYGSKQIRTPHIDRLASEGMRFTEAYSGCTVCAPARCTLMTGMHMGHASIRANPGGVSLQATDVTLAQMLKKAGYACGGFGKWGMGDLDTTGVPEKKGFDRFFGYYHQVHAHHYFPEYLVDTGRKVPLPGNRGLQQPKPFDGAIPSTDPASGLERQFTAHRIQRETLGWIRERGAAPFFCYAALSIPHGAHQVPDDDPAWLLYKDKPWSLDARVHAAFVSMADRFVGEILALLKKMGVDDSTVIFFSSDNGAADTFGGSLDSGGELRGRKTQLYEGGIRIPFIARFPKRIRAGTTSDLPIYFPDVMPTVADLTGVGEFLPRSIDGNSFAGELEGAKSDRGERAMYWEWNEDHFRIPYRVSKQACRKGQWKIVRHAASKPWELYDLARDPSERTDLATANPDKVRELDRWVQANRAEPPEQIEPLKPKGQQWR